MFMTFEKLNVRIQELAEYRYRERMPIQEFAMQPDLNAEIGGAPPQDGDWQSIRLGDRWSGYDAYVWLKADVQVPAVWKDRRIVGCFYFGNTGISNISGFESLLYVNGAAYQGVDSNHQEVFLADTFAGTSLSLCFRLWSGLQNHAPLMLNNWDVTGPTRHSFYADPTQAGQPQMQEHIIGRAEIAWMDEAADDLYFYGKAVLETLQGLPDNDPNRHHLLAALNRSVLQIDWSKPGSQSFYDSVASAQQVLHSELERLEKHSSVTFTCIGHTHIDVAWLWRLKHTREKIARSFSTVLRLMELYPEYIFQESQPQLYDYIKTDYPYIYEQMKARIQEGRWEVEGGMWLEADCNLTSGESLVRQILMGTRFFREEFGKECKCLWLPDAFGYSWALPQIMQKSGLEYFMTIKINSTTPYNKMPHDTFRWRGIDGTDVLTHFAGYAYNYNIDAPTIQDLWNRYKDKELNQNLLLIYGHGDGGGGVNREMLEMRRRLDALPGMFHVETGGMGDYFDRLQQTVTHTDQYVPTWEGELYFEYHRGTYTSQAFIKKLNRSCELALRETEWLNIVQCLLQKDMSLYASEWLHEAWKIVLRNQFHDILPGSSIREVNEDCRLEYEEAVRLISQARNHSIAGLYDHSSARLPEDSSYFTLFNSAPWSRNDLIRIPMKSMKSMKSVESNESNESAESVSHQGSWQDMEGKMLKAEYLDGEWQIYAEEIPSMGFTTIQWISGEKVETKSESFTMPDNSRILTPYYEIEWNEAGQLTRIYDREAQREVLEMGARGNVLQVFEDKPLAHDAWDIDIFYQDKMREVSDLISFEVVECGALRAIIRFEWSYSDSVIRQDMTLYAHSRRIDFVTHVNWHERQQLLKAAFPVAVKSTEATYDIQFGNVKRPTHWNTSWDYARFETVGQQWADLSERGYGVSLLNNCKYGYDIKQNMMRLSLIKSAIYPDYAADQGEHTFTYSLLPHMGDWVEGNTVQEAWQLNNPLTYTACSQPQPELSLIRVSSANIMIDAVKKAEDDDTVIVRVHEFTGSRGTFELASDFPILSWQECDLLERPEGKLSNAPVIQAFIKPYEIKTFKLTF
ncbi:alpha-mannosidase [Paenibacillus eucommiae]|uniref:Alpha-mannosidase n=1 Tax=Paenibacillus eucommiae TaxID=1355755 RepID=A0ABS4ILP7_9BACL|nr:alpha-mannosidase [Paenibacillus eucommiae]MBP1988459.1 alpha-mannosidase [Paenibacillus eucommiae]